MSGPASTPSQPASGSDQSSSKSASDDGRDMRSPSTIAKTDSESYKLVSDIDLSKGTSIVQSTPALSDESNHDESALSTSRDAGGSVMGGISTKHTHWLV